MPVRAGGFGGGGGWLGPGYVNCQVKLDWCEFCMSHCVTCDPAWRILYHVTGSLCRVMSIGLGRLVFAFNALMKIGKLLCGLSVCYIDGYWAIGLFVGCLVLGR